MRSSQSSLPDAGLMGSSDEPSSATMLAKPSGAHQKKHVLVHLSSRHGKSAREVIGGSGSSSKAVAAGGATSRVKKLKFIKVDPTKLVAQDS